MANLLLLFEKNLVEFLLDNICNLKEPSKNRDDQAIFSNDGPNLISPALTNKPMLFQKYINLKIIEAEENLNLKLKHQIKEQLK